jgi:DNA primase
MSRASFIDFRSVKAALSMEQVLQHYGLMDRFKRGPDSLSGPCPIHKGENPTQFRVSLSKNVWNCFSVCKRGGNSLDFIAAMEKATIHAAAVKAVEWFRLDPKPSAKVVADRDESGGHTGQGASSSVRPPVQAPPQPEGTAPNPPLKFRLDKLQRDHPYLTERGLTLETLVDFGVGYCAKGMMEGRIAIPIHNPDGQVVAYSGRHVGDAPEGTPKYKLPPGFRKSLELFNLDRAKAEPGMLIVVEGFFDAMKLHQLGHRKVVALMGSSLSSAQEALLRRHTDKHSQILVMLDGDDAGRSAATEIAARLAQLAFVRIHAFEEGQQPEHLTAEELTDILA